MEELKSLLKIVLVVGFGLLCAMGARWEMEERFERERGSHKAGSDVVVDVVRLPAGTVVTNFEVCNDAFIFTMNTVVEDALGCVQCHGQYRHDLKIKVIEEGEAW